MHNTHKSFRGHCVLKLEKMKSKGFRAGITMKNVSKGLFEMLLHHWVLHLPEEHHSTSAVILGWSLWEGSNASVETAYSYWNH